MKSILVVAASASIAMSLAAGAAPAANGTSQDAALAPITVEAHHAVHEKQVGVSYTGIPIEQVSLSRQVGFGDLDLSTPEGKMKLEKRIKTIAREACGQLKKLYPMELWDTDNRSCVANAVDRAMNQEKTILAGK